jgi:glycine/D-amino acid oxidase-like deaminating enzyme
MYFDVLIVGQGLAGSVLQERLRQRGKNVMVMDPGHVGSASYAAVGLYNPIVLKRLKLVWKAHEFLDAAIPFYRDYESRYGIKLLSKEPVARSINSPDDENSWNSCLGDERFSGLLEPDLKENIYSGIKAEKWGTVARSGRMDVRKFLAHVRKELAKNELLIEERFDRDQLRHGEHWKYGDLEFGTIIFCTGVGQKMEGADFIQPNKGEVMQLEFKRPEGLDKILKAKVFLCPYSDSQAAVGATYSRDSENEEPTEAGRQELIDELAKFCDRPYRIIDHWAGMRPTIPDRRPVLGPWKEDGMYILNGLGSRGVLSGPWLADHLCDHIYDGKPILPELDVRRYLS